MFIFFKYQINRLIHEHLFPCQEQLNISTTGLLPDWHVDYTGHRICTSTYETPSEVPRFIPRDPWRHCYSLACIRHMKAAKKWLPWGLHISLSEPNNAHHEGSVWGALNHCIIKGTLYISYFSWRGLIIQRRKFSCSWNSQRKMPEI